MENELAALVDRQKETIAKLTAQRDALLEALRRIENGPENDLSHLSEEAYYSRLWDFCQEIARATVKQAESK